MIEPTFDKTRQAMTDKTGGEIFGDEFAYLLYVDGEPLAEGTATLVPDHDEEELVVGAPSEGS